MSVVKNKVLRSFLFLLGLISVVLGFIGIFMPVLPTTPFLLLAAWCFLKSSSRAHQWIYSHRLLGPPLIRWQKNRSISRPTKKLALGMIAVSLTIIWLSNIHLGVRIPVTILLVSVSCFIWTRNEG